MESVQIYGNRYRPFVYDFKFAMETTCTNTHSQDCVEIEARLIYITITFGLHLKCMPVRVRAHACIIVARESKEPT